MGWSPLILIELVLVFGGVLLWGGWQLWTLRQENEKAAQRERDKVNAPAETSAQAQADSERH